MIIDEVLAKKITERYAFIAEMQNNVRTGIRVFAATIVCQI